MNPSAPGSAEFVTAPARRRKPWLGGSTLFWFAQVVLAAALLLCCSPLNAQSQDAVSREVSVFNFGLPTAGPDAVSREVSVFNFGLPSAGTDAISREVSVFNFGLPSAGADAVSREVSVFNFGLPSAGTDAISREVTVFNFGLPSAGTDAVSREVSVYNYGKPPLSFAVGSTNILGNQISQVPFSLLTLLDLTNLSLVLLADDSHLQLLGVTPASPEVLAATLGPAGTNAYAISFALNPAAIPQTNHTLAYLNFQGLTNLDSAVIPLNVSNLAGLRVNGQSAPGASANGQVIVIVTKPILFGLKGVPIEFKMLGIPGATYSILATTNLNPPVWIEVQRLQQSGLALTPFGLTNDAPQQFYRAEQVGP